MKQQVEQQEEQPNEKSLQEQEQKWFTLLREEQAKKQEADGSSRISLQLLNSIASDRLPSLFDTEETKELIKALNESDEALNLVRKNKPVVLSDVEAKVVFALGSIFSQFRKNETIQEIIKNPRSEKQQWLNLDLKSLSKFINGTSRKREVEKMRDTIERLSITKQILPSIKWTDEEGKVWKRTISTPLLRTWAGVHDELIDKSKAKPNEETEQDHIIIELSRVYFMGLNDRFAILPSNLFEVWRGWQGELLQVLFSSVLAAHVRSRNAAKKLEKRLQKENKNLKENKLSEEELQEKIKQRQEEARIWEYELTYESIKKKLVTDYESTKQYKSKFKKDLLRVIKNLKEMGLITDRTQIDVKAKTGKKVIFFLNENRYKHNGTNTLPPITGHKLLPPINEA